MTTAIAKRVPAPFFARRYNLNGAMFLKEQIDLYLQEIFYFHPLDAGALDVIDEEDEQRLQEYGLVAIFHTFGSPDKEMTIACRGRISDFMVLSAGDSCYIDSANGFLYYPDMFEGVKINIDTNDEGVVMLHAAIPHLKFRIFNNYPQDPEYYGKLQSIGIVVRMEDIKPSIAMDSGNFDRGDLFSIGLDRGIGVSQWGRMFPDELIEKLMVDAKNATAKLTVEDLKKAQELFNASPKGFEGGGVVGRTERQLTEMERFDNALAELVRPKYTIHIDKDAWFNHYAAIKEMERLGLIED